MPDQPKSILYIRPDTIGDLVIFSAALDQLLKEWPQAEHTLLVRTGYDTLSSLLPSSLRWLASSINPFTQKPSEVEQELKALTERVALIAPDLIVAPTLNRTWLEPFIANHFPSARRVALGKRAVDPLFANTLEIEFNIEAHQAFSESVEADEKLRDWENNHRLVEQLIGHTRPKAFPSLQLSEEARGEAQTELKTLGLSFRHYIIVFVGGLANVPIKAWPSSKFGELITWLQRVQPHPVLVAGHISETNAVDEVIAQAIEHGARPPQRWLGRDGKVSLLAAILEGAAFYVGHDTGAMHIAAAVGRPVVGIFGGGHWPRFRPAGAEVVAVVQPLPCFGCNWDCIFGDAPCVKAIGLENVQQGVNLILAKSGGQIDEVVTAKHFSDDALRLIAAVNPHYSALRGDRVERQYRIEELKHETNGKDREIVYLKTEADKKDREILTKELEIKNLLKICDERASVILELDLHAKDMTALITKLRDAGASKERCLEARDVELTLLKGQLSQVSNELLSLKEAQAKQSAQTENWEKIVHDKNVHIQNLDNILAARTRQLAIAEASIANYSSGYAHLEQFNFFHKLLAEKEAVIRSLMGACREREDLIKGLALESAGPFGKVGKLAYAAREHARIKWWRPLAQWTHERTVGNHWMKIGVLQQYLPRPIKWDRIPKPRLSAAELPQIGIVTPSYGQANFIESTLLSVLNQKYPKLRYVVQDGGSKDSSPQIIARYSERLSHWESVRDNGQADAIGKGFKKLETELGANDIMAWLNSDDLIAPHALDYIGFYFSKHPEVDVVYGHRIIIDGEDRDVGRWIMPKHDPEILEWIDYVPQETLFWRKRIWDQVGGIDPSFQFALDWDLIARFQAAKAKIVRLPYFLGCFRVHAMQKTSQHIHTIGNEEMRRIRARFHGEKENDVDAIHRAARRSQLRGAITSRLLTLGIRV